MNPTIRKVRALLDEQMVNEKDAWLANLLVFEKDPDRITTAQMKWLTSLSEREGGRFVATD